MEIKKEGFDDIRPYYDDEIPSAIAKLLADPQFRKVVETNLPQINWEDLKSRMSAINNKYDFQGKIIKQIVFAMLAGRTQAADCSGLENISPAEAYTYISNHRDIVLDASILCILLLDSGYDTSEICLGDNLLAQPWITEFVRINKGIIVKRGVGTRRQYEVSKQLSEYMQIQVALTKSQRL